MPQKLKGSLYRRGDTWWITYQLNGHRVAESLGTKDEARAKLERDRIIGPLLARTATERVKVIARRVLDAGGRALRQPDDPDGRQCRAGRGGRQADADGTAV